MLEAWKRQLPFVLSKWAVVLDGRGQGPGSPTRFSVDIAFQWPPLPQSSRALRPWILGGGWGVVWPDSLPSQRPRSRVGKGLVQATHCSRHWDPGTREAAPGGHQVNGQGTVRRIQGPSWEARTFPRLHGGWEATVGKGSDSAQGVREQTLLGPTSSQLDVGGLGQSAQGVEQAAGHRSRGTQVPGLGVCCFSRGQPSNGRPRAPSCVTLDKSLRLSES